jgi:hypothetical protein
LRTEHHRFVQAQLEGINFSQLTDHSQPATPNPETPAEAHPQEADDDRPQ